MYKWLDAIFCPCLVIALAIADGKLYIYQIAQLSEAAASVASN